MDILDRLRLKIQRIPAGSYHTCGDACTNTDCLLVGARQKIEELEARMAAAEAMAAADEHAIDAIRERNALAARLAEAEFDLKSASEAMQRYARDAKRYRWCRHRLLVTAVRCSDDEIRMMPLGIASVSTEDYASSVDAAIDEEIAASETVTGSEP